MSRPAFSYRTLASQSGSTASMGASSAAGWLKSLELTESTTLRWHVEIALDVVDAPAQSEFAEDTATRFHLDIYSEEWGVFFCHAGKSSWIRITDHAFVHGRDDHRLLPIVPPLRDIGSLLRKLEQVHDIHLHRKHALIRTNLEGAEPAIRAWLAAL